MPPGVRKTEVGVKKRVTEILPEREAKDWRAFDKGGIQLRRDCAALAQEFVDAANDLRIDV